MENDISPTPLPHSIEDSHTSENARHRVPNIIIIFRHSYTVCPLLFRSRPPFNTKFSRFESQAETRAFAMCPPAFNSQRVECLRRALFPNGAWLTDG